jgi:hypothetical protein
MMEVDMGGDDTGKLLLCTGESCLTTKPLGRASSAKDLLWGEIHASSTNTFSAACTVSVSSFDNFGPSCVTAQKLQARNLSPTAITRFCACASSPSTMSFSSDSPVH